MSASKPSLLELLARVHISLADIAGRQPFPEAAHLVSIGEDCHGRRARLTPDAAEAWHALRAAAQADGVELLVVSAFRSYERQTQLWERKLAAGQTPAEIRRVLTVPGFSEHHTGCALDLGTPGGTDLTESFEATPAFAWLTQRARAFGYFMTYPRENSLGVAYEPWHWCWRDTMPPNMHASFEARDDRVEVTVTGHWSFAEFRPLLESIRGQCAQHGVAKVLVDARSIPDNPAAADRYEAGKLLATIMPEVKVALLFDPARTTRLAENTAVNRGASLAIFGEPDEALGWLAGLGPAR